VCEDNILAEMIGSHSRDLLGDDKISLATSVSEAGLNTV